MMASVTFRQLLDINKVDGLMFSLSVNFHSPGCQIKNLTLSVVKPDTSTLFYLTLALLNLTRQIFP